MGEKACSCNLGRHAKESKVHKGKFGQTRQNCNLLSTPASFPIDIPVLCKMLYFLGYSMLLVIIEKMLMGPFMFTEKIFLNFNGQPKCLSEENS